MAFEPSHQRKWPLPTAVASGIVIFAGTFFAYAERTHKEPSHLPLVAAIAIFAVVITLLTTAMFRKSSVDQS